MNEAETPVYRRAARLILFCFFLTFAAARITVFLIMTRRIPDFYLFLGQTHVHHLNYGIFLLSGVGAYLLLVQESVWHRHIAEALYGIGLGLTFDEFGMWLNLGGSYWQRASFDAVVIIAAVFGLLAVAPPWKKFKSHHWAGLGVLLAVGAAFWYLWTVSLDYAARHLGPKLKHIEEQGPR